MTPFWTLITVFGLIAAIINFAIAVVRRREWLVALVRGLAGFVGLALSAGILVGKDVLRLHPDLQLSKPEVFTASGVVIFALLLLPSYAGQRGQQARVTMQQRAARPAKATVRLERPSSDEWVN